MKLQLALDDITLAAALALVEDVRTYVDIIEVGTPFLYAEGLGAVRELRRRFPEKEILADMKIMDAGEHETRLALQAGADYVTVLGVDAARRRAHALRGQAHAALARSTLAQPARLALLADRIVDRES